MVHHSSLVQASTISNILFGSSPQAISSKILIKLGTVHTADLLILAKINTAFTVIKGGGVAQLVEASG